MPRDGLRGAHPGKHGDPLGGSEHALDARDERIETGRDVGRRRDAHSCRNVKFRDSNGPSLRLRRGLSGRVVKPQYLTLPKHETPRFHGKPLADPKLHAILITSWNEWNEDTVIEPLSPSAPTADDVSGRQLFTQGYTYEGFGSAYLDVVRDHLRH